MKVKTDYVPDHCEYFTVGKGYDVIETFDNIANIQNDENKMVAICLEQCEHLDGKPWQIIEDSFDLKTYHFSDSDNIYAEVIDKNIFIMDSSGYYPTTLSKKDVIVIAKALGVKGSDL